MCRDSFCCSWLHSDALFLVLAVNVVPCEVNCVGDLDAVAVQGFMDSFGVVCVQIEDPSNDGLPVPKGTHTAWQ